MTKVQPVFLARQGDVGFRRIAALPTGERKVVKNGVIREGEATGHCHAVMEEALTEGLAEVLDIGEGRFVNVTAEGGISIVHQEHAPVELPAGVYEVIGQREYSPQEIRNVRD